MIHGRRLSVAVIGAGAAGAMAARTLADHGHEVRVFEKSRGVGGRMATRRGSDRDSGSDLQFDHGAQYFTLRDPRLARLRDGWAEAGVIAPWAQPDSSAATRWVAVPGMNALARHLLDPVAVRTRFTVESLERHEGCWSLAGRAAAGALEIVGGFDAAVVAAPAPQAASLLGGVTPLAERLKEAEYAPCWAVMASGIDAASQPDLLRAARQLCAQADPDGPVAWAAHDGDKPGRSGQHWVLQAGSRWSQARLERTPAEVARAMWTALAESAGVSPALPPHLEAHRWRYARVVRALDRECLWDEARQLAACGDYCLGPRVEAALLSGAAAAGRLVSRASGAR